MPAYTGTGSSYLTLTPEAPQVVGENLGVLLAALGRGDGGHGGRGGGHHHFRHQGPGWEGPYYAPYDPYYVPPLCVEQPTGRLVPCNEGPVVIQTPTVAPNAILMGEMGLDPSLNQAENPTVSTQPGDAVVGQYNLSHLTEGNFTSATIDAMHRAVMKAKTDETWRSMMEDIRRAGRQLGAIGWKDYPGELAWMDRWYRGPNFIDYVRDQHQVERVAHSMLTYMKRLGDCDDSSTLMAASMGALGAPHRFRTYKADPRRPNEWSHVVSQIWVPGMGWVNDDLTIRNATPGFEPIGFVTKDWPEPNW